MRGGLAGIYCGKVGKFWHFFFIEGFPYNISEVYIILRTWWVFRFIHANEIYILCVHLWTHLVRNVLREVILKTMISTDIFGQVNMIKQLKNFKKNLHTFHDATFNTKTISGTSDLENFFLLWNIFTIWLEHITGLIHHKRFTCMGTINEMYLWTIAIICSYHREIKY